MPSDLGAEKRVAARRQALRSTARHVAPTIGLVIAFGLCFAGLIYLAQDLRAAALTDIAAHRLTAVAALGAQVTFVLSMLCGLFLIGAGPAAVLAWWHTKQFYRQALAREIEGRAHG
ncbi:MAG: hypothetical protein ACRYHQ_16130 [Janthinobacterium lividum]